MANDATNRWTDGPWWAQLIKTIGVTATLLVALLGFFLHAWSQDRDRAAEDLRANTVSIRDLKENLLLHAQDTAYGVKSLDRIHNVIMATCLNGAMDEDQRQRCVNGAER